jgi:predicted nucleic acid-binding protein
MVTAVDTSVRLDVLLNDPRHASASIAALRRAAAEGSLIICEIALAEVIPTLQPVDIPQFLSDWNLTFIPSSQSSAILAGEMFRIYLERGGKRERVIPDFLLAAHAQTHANRLLARDRGYYRDYFKQLRVWDPATGSEVEARDSTFYGRRYPARLRPILTSGNLNLDQP